MIKTISLCPDLPYLTPLALTTTFQYTFKTCARVLEVIGRRASSFIVESADCRLQLPLTMPNECDMLPDNQNEIPAHGATHLRDIAVEIPVSDLQADKLLLLGRCYSDPQGVQSVDWTSNYSICTEVSSGVSYCW